MNEQYFLKIYIWFTRFKTHTKRWNSIDMSPSVIVVVTPLQNFAHALILEPTLYPQGPIFHYHQVFCLILKTYLCM